MLFSILVFGLFAEAHIGGPNGTNNCRYDSSLGNREAQSHLVLLIRIRFRGFSCSCIVVLQGC